MSTTAVNNWTGIDLHVHTPASDDYKGSKDENEYFRIILSASRKLYKNDKITDGDLENRIRLLAVTDHNSIEGYRILRAKRIDAINLVHGLKNRGLQVNDDLREECELYENVHILMGVEIKAYPGVHIQVIFREDVNEEDVVSFLERGTGKEYSTFEGNPDVAFNWRIDEVFDEVDKTFSSHALVIAPHVDRTNGLLEVLKNSPQAKMAALKHSVLKCISFNNVETREYLKRNVFTQNEYQREGAEVSYIQSSDFHGEPGFDIGHVYTKININDDPLGFDSLINALSCVENVKCSIDFAKETYAALTEGFTVKTFKSYIQDKLVIASDDFRDLTDMVCGYLNTNGGIIEVTGNVSPEVVKTYLIEDATSNIKNVIEGRLQPSNIEFKL